MEEDYDVSIYVTLHILKQIETKETNDATTTAEISTRPKVVESQKLFEPSIRSQINESSIKYNIEGGSQPFFSATKNPKLY